MISYVHYIPLKTLALKEGHRIFAQKPIGAITTSFELFLSLRKNHF